MSPQATDVATSFEDGESAFSELGGVFTLWYCPVSMNPQDTASAVLEVVPRPLPYYTIRLQASRELFNAAPGQFVMLRAESSLEPYLRRAFSVFDRGEDEQGLWIEILGKIIGVLNAMNNVVSLTTEKLILY